MFVRFGLDTYIINISVFLWCFWAGQWHNCPVANVNYGHVYSRENRKVNTTTHYMNHSEDVL